MALAPTARARNTSGNGDHIVTVEAKSNVAVRRVLDYRDHCVRFLCAMSSPRLERPCTQRHQRLHFFHSLSACLSLGTAIARLCSTLAGLRTPRFRPDPMGV
jgi:hypothetical protein